MPLDQLPEALRNEKHATRDEGRTLSVQTDAPAAVIVELVKWIDQHGLRLVDIHLKRPTLEDVFIELTGKRLRE
jgi:ABC-2 type transport system ATP-binding protein